MSNNIKIGVQATFDAAALEQKINALGQKIAQSNRSQYNPISVKSIADAEKLIKRFEQLLKIQGDLNRRVRATNQTGVGITDLNWEQLYPDVNSRARHQRRAFEYVTGSQFGGASGGGGGGAGGAGGGNGGGRGARGAGSVVSGAVHAGLNAAGPAGRIASGAISEGVSVGGASGMAAGFGAGLMGLVGGVVAMGVGKLVSGVMDKVDTAEKNAIAMDKLKRVIGDVNVSFGALKSVVNASASNLKITYDEAGRLASQFSKAGNLKSNQFTSIADELGVGVGLSRAYGLDPSQGVGVMGQLRGVGATTNTQESRRFALLIGETIGRSGAFAKADEVMEAMASFTVSQTRNNLGVANTSGYAGMLSGMVGSGIPGMDVAGSVGMLSRINSSLSGGGSKGEASQFFTAQVGAGMGLDPIQTQIMREGGAFATNESMFGKGSAASRFGIRGPGGNTTFLQATIAKLRQKYGSNKGLLAQATANHLGIGINQAMGILSINPNQMGEMQKYGDLGKLNAAGIGNMSKALYGTSDDRKDIARNLLGRSDVSAADKKTIEGVMGNGTEQSQKEVLARLSAQYDQEKTLGKDIADSKAILDNINTDLADKLIPVMNEMRHGIMAIAGVGKDGKTSNDIMKQVLGADSVERFESIKRNYAGKIDPLTERAEYLRNKQRTLDPSALMMAYRDNPKILEEKLKERGEVQKELVEVEKKIKALEDEKKLHLEKENARWRSEISALDKSTEQQTLGVQPINFTPDPSTGGGRGKGYSESGSDVVGGPQRGSAGGPSRQDLINRAKELDVDPATALAIFGQESSGNWKSRNSPRGAEGGMQVMPNTYKAMMGTSAGRGDPWNNMEAGLRYLRHGEKVLGTDNPILLAAGYHAGYGHKSLKRGMIPNTNDGLISTSAYARNIAARVAAERRRGGDSLYAPLPKDAPDSSRTQKQLIHFEAQPIEVIVKNERGQRISHGGSQAVSGRFSQPAPFGTGGNVRDTAPPPPPNMTPVSSQSLTPAERLERMRRDTTIDGHTESHGDLIINKERRQPNESGIDYLRRSTTID